MPITYIQRDAALAAENIVATHELSLLDTTQAAATISVSVPASASDIRPIAFTGPEVGLLDWPVVTDGHTVQADVTAAGSNLSYRPIWVRITSDTTASLNAAGAGTLSGTGLKLWTLAFSSANNNAGRQASDRLQVQIGVSNGNSMSAQTLSLRLNTGDSSARAPWAKTGPISESFDQSNSTIIGPQEAWVEVTGDWTTASGQLVPPTGAGVVRVDRTPGGGDVALSTSVTAQTFPTLTAMAAGLVARSSADGATQYVANLESDALGNRTWNLRKRVGGTDSLIASLAASGAAAVPSPPWTFGFRVTGTLLELLVGGSAILSANDSSITGDGSVGYRTNNANGWRFDWFTAEVPSGPTLEVVATALQTVWEVQSRTASALATPWNVADRAASDRAAVWNVTERVPPSVLGSLWDVRSPAATSLAAPWNVAARSSSALFAQWHVFDRLAVALAGLWDVADRARSDADARWNVGASVDSSLGAQWDVAGALAMVGSELSARWDLADHLASVLSAPWEVRGRAAMPLVARWDVASRAGTELAAAWALTGRTSSDLGAQWSVAARQASALGVGWNVGARVTTDLGGSWHVGGRADSVLTAQWATFAGIGSVLASRWDLFGRTGSDLAGLWDVVGAPSVVGTSLGALWDILALAPSDLVAPWNVASRVVAPLQTRWDVAMRAATALGGAWDVRERAGSTLAGLWEVVGAPSLVGTDLGALWTTRAPLASTLGTTWQVGQRQGVALAAPWDVRVLASSATTGRWDVRAPVQRILDTRWDVLVPLATLLAARWDVASRAGSDLGAAWDVTAPVLSTLLALWNIGVLMDDRMPVAAQVQLARLRGTVGFGLGGSVRLVGPRGSVVLTRWSGEVG
jgi:hypothetical protein